MGVSLIIDKVWGVRTWITSVQFETLTNGASLQCSPPPSSSPHWNGPTAVVLPCCCLTFNLVFVLYLFVFCKSHVCICLLKKPYYWNSCTPELLSDLQACLPLAISWPTMWPIFYFEDEAPEPDSELRDVYTLHSTHMRRKTQISNSADLQACLLPGITWPRFIFADGLHS